VPYILATLLPIKEQRITMPYLPIIAVISAVGLQCIRRQSVRRSAILLVICYGLLLWWANSLGYIQTALSSRTANPVAEIAFFDQHSVRSPRDYSLQPGDWKQLKLMETIQADAALQGILLPVDVPLVANTSAYNPNTLNYISLLYDMKLQFLYTWSWMGNLSH